MKFYILDDDLSITVILQNIVEQDFNHTVIKTATSAKEAYQDLLIAQVDIVLVDLLMPDINGIMLVKQIKSLRNDLKFIMISQVRDHDLRQEAYEAGIEFFIDKPINIVEVKKVVERVTTIIEMENKLKSIQQLLGEHQVNPAEKEGNTKQQEKIRSIISYLGIASESGYTDIIMIAQKMLETHLTFEQLDFEKHFSMDNHQQKVVLQRIRRAIKKAMLNIAHLCIDDFDNEITLKYANSLFGYQNIHKEIRVIQGYEQVGGKVSIKHFFNELVIQIQH